MGFNAVDSIKCLFCSGRSYIQHCRVFHPFKRDHGPFDIYACIDCGSCQTEPLPSAESLTALYESYRDGLPDLHRRIMADDPQTALYTRCLNRLRRISGQGLGDEFKWLDVGGGGGEFAALMAKAFPHSQGTVIDLHPCPKLLEHAERVDWQQVDINEEAFSERLSQRFHCIVSIAVWEHVLRPDWFVANLLRMLRPGGMIYLLCPNNASLASRLLGRRWPYFTPGEHLSMPTPSGAVQCLRRECFKILKSDNGIRFHARSLLLPYTFRYVLRRLGADRVGRLFPSGWALPLPAGVLEATVLLPQTKIIGGM